MRQGCVNTPIVIDCEAIHMFFLARGANEYDGGDGTDVAGSEAAKAVQGVLEP